MELSAGALGVRGVEVHEVLQVLRAAGGALHPAQVGERADQDLDSESAGRLGVSA